MEQKRILWIVISLSVFMLIIFGVALLLYSPTYSSNSAGVTDVSSYVERGDVPEHPSVDPSLWLKNPEKIPELGKTPAPTQRAIPDLTVVKDVPTARAKSLDVSPPARAERTDAAQDRKTSPASDTRESAESKGASKHARSDRASAKSPPATRTRAPLVAQRDARVRGASTQPAAPSVLFWVQAASLSSKLNAERARGVLAARHMKAEIFTKRTGAGLRHRVRVGPFTNHTEAVYWMKSIREIAEFSGCYVFQERVKN